MKKKKFSNSLIIILMLLVIAAGACGIYKYVTMERPNLQGEVVDTGTEEEPLVVEPKKEVQTFVGTDRPIAVMIDNHSGAWPQANLEKAYIVYEIVVEGKDPELLFSFLVYKA